MGRFDGKWRSVEVVITMRGRKHLLWRAVDSRGEVRDILAQFRRNKRAAGRFFRKLFKAFGEPRVIVAENSEAMAPP